MAQVIHNKVTIIIPFFQKERGILTKAIKSALAQKGIANLEILVVDDSSPVSATSELQEIAAQHPGKIKIIEQPNAGPAAARNRGLDNVDVDTEYVAFLDSDDEWIETHLSNALSALGHGYDFYFADHFQLNQTISAFNRAKRIRPEEHPKISSAGYLYQYTGDMFDQILSGNIIGTSTVVYRHKKFPALHFREEFVYAGEDYLFWLELSKLTDKITFSSLCECAYGPGVNVFSGSGWGTEKSLIRLHYEMKFRKAVATLFDLNSVQAGNNKNVIAGLRKSFIADILHRLSHNKPIDRRTIVSQFKVDPQTFIYFFPIAVSLLARSKS